MTNESEPRSGPVVPGPQAIHLPEDQDHPRAVPQDQQRTTSGPRTTFDPIDWDERIRAAVAKTLQQRAHKRAEREELKLRRDYGLVQRYAAKTARNRNNPPKETP